MTTYDTGNPLGSADPRDLYDNAENTDAAVNGEDRTWVDRFGRTRVSMKGVEEAVPDAIAARDRAEAAASSAQLQAGATPYQSYAAMAATAPAEGVWAVVLNDANTSLNGYYQRTAGAWVRTTLQPTNSTHVYEILDSLSELRRVAGYMGDLPFIETAGAAMGQGYYIFSQPLADDAKLRRVTFRSHGGGVLGIGVWVKNGTTFTRRVATSFPVAASADAQAHDLHIDAKAGEYLGFVCEGASVVARYTSTTGTILQESVYASTVVNPDNPGLRTDLRASLFIEAEQLETIDEINEAIDQRVPSAELDAISDFEVVNAGASRPLPESTFTSNPDDTNWSMTQPLGVAGSAIAFYVRTSAAGPVRALLMRKIGAQMRIEHTFKFEAPAAGEHRFALSEPVFIDADHYAGFYSSVVMNRGGGPFSNGFMTGRGDTLFTPSAPNLTRELLVGFEVRVRKIKQTNARPSYANLPFENMLVIGAGQSLMEGSQTSTSGTAPVTTTQEYDSVGFAAYPAAPVNLLPATVTNTQRATNRGEWPGLGAAAAIRRALMRDNNIAFKDTKSTVVIANDAIGGSNIEMLSKGTAAYNAGISQASALVGLTPGRCGALSVIWGQGEADSVLTRAEYRDALLQLAKDYDADLRAATGQTQRVPLISYQLCTRRKDIALAQLDAAHGGGLVSLLGPMYQWNYYDSVHIDSVSARRLGGLYGEAVKQIAIDGKRWEPLWPVACEMRAGALLLTFNKAGLQLDTALVPQQNNYGFQVLDATGVELPLTALSVQNGSQVRLSLANPAAAARVVYGVTAVGKGPLLGRAGNLRDNAGASRVFDDYPLHNWCVEFDWTV